MLVFGVASLGQSIPEITEMRLRAIFEAAANVRRRGIKVEPRSDDSFGWEFQGIGTSSGHSSVGGRKK